MEGIYFYWLFWMFWIISAFFMKRSASSWRMSAAILFLIAISGNDVNIMGTGINAAAAILFLIAIGTVAFSQQERTRLFVAVMISALFMTAIRFLQLVDPAIIIFSESLLPAAAGSVVPFFFLHSPFKRISAFAIAVAQAEFIYMLHLDRIGLPYSPGTLSFLDHAAIGLAIIITLTIFEAAAAFLEHSMQKYNRQRQGKL